jgi:hypothetical protein
MKQQTSTQAKRAWLLVRDAEHPDQWQIRNAERSVDSQWKLPSDPWYASTQPQAGKRLVEKWKQSRQPLVLLLITPTVDVTAGTASPITGACWYAGDTSTAQPPTEKPQPSGVQLPGLPMAWPAVEQDTRGFHDLQKLGLKPLAVVASGTSDTSPRLHGLTWLKTPAAIPANSANGSSQVPGPLFGWPTAKLAMAMGIINLLVSALLSIPGIATDESSLHTRLSVQLQNTLHDICNNPWKPPR